MGLKRIQLKPMSDTPEQQKRSRGRPPKPGGAMSDYERVRRSNLRKLAEKLSTPEVQVICVLRKRDK